MEEMQDAYREQDAERAEAFAAIKEKDKEIARLVRRIRKKRRIERVLSEVNLELEAQKDELEKENAELEAKNDSLKLQLQRANTINRQNILRICSRCGRISDHS